MDRPIDQLVIERKLLDLALIRGYLASERDWYTQEAIRLGQRMEFDVQEPQNELEETIIKGDAELQFLAIPTFSRVIYTPTGYVEYILNYDRGNEDSPQDEPRVRNGIAEGVEFTESMHIKAGPRIPEGVSPNVDMNARDRNASVYLHFIFDTQNEKIAVAEMSPQFPGEMDSLGRLVTKPNTGYAPLDAFIGALHVFEPMGKIPLEKYQGRGYNEKIHSHWENKPEDELLCRQIPAIDALFEDLPRVLE